MTVEDTAGEVLAVEPLPLPYYTLSLRLPARFAAVAPGQFVMIQTDPLDPYLRRAFSVFDVNKGDWAPTGRANEPVPGAFGGERPVTVELLGKVIGAGTRRLAELEPRQQRAVLGPLGRGFRVVPGRAKEPASRSLPEAESPRPALVAGGVGSAALLLLARTLYHSGRAFDFYYGGRARIDLACGSRFEALARAHGGRYVVTTEDGSAGRRGLVTEPLEEALEAGRHDAVYTCGPLALMARVAELAAFYGVVGQAALETPMGCGFGACIGCAVPVLRGGYALCCRDGPVFELEEVDWPNAH